MVKNYLKIAFRILSKEKGYSLINILGLATGVVCSLLIYLYVTDEFSFDRYHEGAGEIYRVTQVPLEGIDRNESATTPFPLAEALKNDFPADVHSAVRFFNMRAPRVALRYEWEAVFNERRFYFVDPEVFDVFRFTLEKGNPETALVNPNTVVMTQSKARKYFGDADPIGKVLRFEGRADLEVTGIIDEVPPNSHFHFDFLISMGTLENIYARGMPDDWFWNPCWTYIRLNEGADAGHITDQLAAFSEKYLPEVQAEQITFGLQPLLDIRLRSDLNREHQPNNNILYIYIYSLIALIILLIACINFMNLTTARSAARAREIGMRKVFGAERRQLITQFLSESMVMSLIAVLVSVVVLQLILPTFNTFVDKNLTFNPLADIRLFFLLAGITLSVGLFSGVYPALFLSSFPPLKTIQGTLSSGGKTPLLRQGLVTLQFSVSIALIIGTMITYNQLNHLRQTEPGFEREQVVIIPSSMTLLIWYYDDYKARLLEHSGILSVTGLEEVLGKDVLLYDYTAEGVNDGEPRMYSRLYVHHDFVETFDIDVLAGRGFSSDYAADAAEAVMLNKSMVEQFGWGGPEEALGRSMRRDNTDLRVIGVVDDFNAKSLHSPVEPLILDIPYGETAVAQYIKYIAVRLAPGDPSDALAYMSEVWTDIDRGRPFEYFFLDSELEKLYETEEMMGNVAGIFALLCILVACLGLFSLASYMSQARTREIGIRKVMGASVPSIVGLLSKEFVKLLIIANLIAWPVSWLLLSRWLENFAYRTDLSLLFFVLAGLLALIIALLTVSWQTTKAALANPVESLRDE